MTCLWAKNGGFLLSMCERISLPPKGDDAISSKDYINGQTSNQRVNHNE